MRKAWTTREEANVRTVHASGIAYAQMMHLWPGRTPKGVSAHASEMGLGPRPVPIRRDVSRTLPLMLKELLKGACDAYALADRIGVNREWAGRLLRANLTSDDPQVQVVRWYREKPVGPYREVWARGHGEIAERPVVLSRVERKRLTRASRRAAKASPFAVAAGLAQVPISRPGRVFNLLRDDDLEEAA